MAKLGWMGLATLLVSGWVFGQPPAQERPDPGQALAGIDEVIEQALVDQKIPGASVGVIVDGEVVLLKGYGLRDVGGNKPMTPDTLLPIASVTKQFTVAALGTLVRQGKLDWDAPVRDYLPDFRLHDDYATLHATPRDLVTHRIGLPRHDFAWFGSSLDRDGLYGKLRHFPFSKDIRTTFQYNNFMYMTAGLLGGRIAGTSYEQLVETAILEPLRMTRSNFSLAELARDPDAAFGYELDNDRRIVREEFESAEQMAPTGGLNSSAAELLNWTKMMLAGGEFEGKRVLLEADVQAMMRPNMAIGQSAFPEIEFFSYGMGLFVGSYRGHVAAQHGGNMPGAATVVMLLPREKIGIVVLTNRSAARLRDGLAFELADRLLGLPSANMIARNAEMEAKLFAGEDAAEAEGASDRKPGTKPAHGLEDYAGYYSDPGYGPLEVKYERGKLSMTYNGYSAPLEHWHYEVFQAPKDATSVLDRARIQFKTDLEGEVSGVAVPMDPNVELVVFARQPPPEMLDAAFLRRFVGTYDLGGIDLDVVLREDGVLQAVRLGRVIDLVPVRGTLFRLKGITGQSMEFLETRGRIDRAALHGGGSLIAPKIR